MNCLSIILHKSDFIAPMSAKTMCLGTWKAAHRFPCSIFLEKFIFWHTRAVNEKLYTWLTKQHSGRRHRYWKSSPPWTLPVVVLEPSECSGHQSSGPRPHRDVFGAAERSQPSQTKQASFIVIVSRDFLIVVKFDENIAHNDAYIKESVRLTRLVSESWIGRLCALSASLQTHVMCHQKFHFYTPKMEIC